MISLIEKSKIKLMNLFVEFTTKEKVFPTRKEHLYKSSSIRIELTHKQNDINSNITEFWLKPSRDIKIFNAIVTVGAFKDEIKGERNILYKRNEWYLLAGYESVEENLVWNFELFGEDNEKGKPFIISISYKT